MNWLLHRLLSPLVSDISGRVDYLQEWMSWLQTRNTEMSAEIDALKAAVAHNDEVNGKVVAYLSNLKTELESVTAKLAELSSVPTHDPAELQALADDLNAHSAVLEGIIPPA